VYSILQTFEFINQQNNNAVHVDIDPDIPEVLSGDQMKISQVLMNLISNASKFTQDGAITISIKSAGKKDQKTAIAFCIKDTGIGIPEEQQSKIFDEFAQITNSSDYEGTGLGLPIVNKILTLLGSTLTFESSYGKGTTFRFTIPFDVGLETDLERIKENTIDYKKLDQKKILIVDDNKINQLVTQKVLEQYGILHRTASNGKEALHLVKENTFDIILMDVNMPVMNGLESSKAMRELEIETPIIALTAINSTDPEKDFASFGINDAIIKPYKTEKVLELLLKYI
jgi:CheY-like chemotaxis protein